MELSKVSSNDHAHNNRSSDGNRRLPSIQVFNPQKRSNNHPYFAVSNSYNNNNNNNNLCSNRVNCRNITFPYSKLLSSSDDNDRLLVQFLISKEDLKHLELISQVDSKFLITKLPERGLVFIMDQHAVHERILLEKFFLEVFQNIESQTLADKRGFQVDLSLVDYHQYLQYQDALERWGWGFVLNNERNRLLVNKIPVVYGTLLDSENHLRQMILDLSQMPSKGKEASEDDEWNSSVPRCIKKLLVTKACRTAVKFGDKLSWMVSSNLVKMLAFCQSPFQCAHGRPTMHPLFSFK